MTKALDKSKLTTERTGILARDPSKAIQEMMQMIDVLQIVYQQETDALSNADTKRFMALQDKKIEAARNYQASISQIIERKDEMKAINPVLKQTLRAKQAAFTQETEKNLLALERMNKSVRRLGDRMRRAARDSVARESVNYGAKGHLKTHDRPLSVGLNESA